jgi:hypothetical protein
VRSALRTRDVDRSSRSLAASLISNRLARTERRMTNELDRVITINDLSEMLGVPVDSPGQLQEAVSLRSDPAPQRQADGHRGGAFGGGSTAIEVSVRHICSEAHGR